MPVYEYKCKKCDKILEVIKSINDDSPEICTKCGGDTEKLISLSTFQLKGGGWFRDGYSNEKHNKKNKA